MPLLRSLGPGPPDDRRGRPDVGPASRCDPGLSCQAFAVSDTVPARTLSKHELQYTGRSLRGAKGTIAWPPQLPQIAAWNSRGPPAVRARFATARHEGHRCGSLRRPLLLKKACSPLEKTNSSEQSRQVNDRSWYTLSRTSCSFPLTRGVPAPERTPGVDAANRRGVRAIGRFGGSAQDYDRQNTCPVKRRGLPNSNGDARFRADLAGIVLGSCRS